MSHYYQGKSRGMGFRLPSLKLVLFALKFSYIIEKGLKMIPENAYNLIQNVWTQRELGKKHRYAIIYP